MKIGGASDLVIRRLAEGRTVRSVGVEEELLIVEPGTGRPRALAGVVIRAVGRLMDVITAAATTTG